MDPLEVSPRWIDLDFSEPAGIFEPFFLYQYRGNAASRNARLYSELAAAQPYGAMGIAGVDVAVEPGLHAAATYAAIGLQHITATERGAGAAHIVLVRLATSDPARKGSTIVLDGCRMTFV